MTWIAIIGWILLNLPDLIAMLRRIFNRTREGSLVRDTLRSRLSAIIQNDRYSRGEKRLLVRREIMRAESALVDDEILEAHLQNEGQP